MSVILLGTLACTTSSPDVDGDDETGVDETETGTDDDNNNEDDPEPECTTDSDCPEDFVCIGGEYCEPLDIGPCECPTAHVCMDEECVPVEGLPSCAEIEVTATETFMLPGNDGDFALAEIDGNPGLEIIGVSLDRAITWIGGTTVESPVTFPGGTSLQIAALRGNQDEALDVAVTIPSVHILYHLAGDGAGGFANEMQRNFGGNPPWDVARVRTGPGVDGMIVKLALDRGSEQQLYLDAATSVQPEQVLDGYIDRWPVDLDGDDIDELIIHRDDMTSIWKLEGEAFIEVAQLPTSIELPSNDPWPTTETCDGFAAGDLDGDSITDIVCLIRGYAYSSEFGVLVPFFHAGEFVFERGEPTIVEAGGENLRFFDLEGDGTPELLLSDAVVDIGASGSFDCSSPHALGLGEVGNLDGDAADEVVNWGATLAPFIYDLSW